MNKPLRRIAVAVMAMFAAMLININYIQVVRAEDLRTERGNSRLILEEYSRERGPILVAGTEVARSEETDGALRFLRRYPEGPLYAAVTGFYSSVYGATGTERAENAILSGTDDRLFVRRILDTLTGEANRGGSVALTVDPAAQQAAAQGLGERPGAVVALEPATGKILAMASSPTYDPGVLAGADSRAVTTAFEALNTDPSRPLLNRALSEIYPPGSTFKIVTTAAALESGSYTPDSEVYGGAELDLPQSSATLPNSSGAACTGGETTTLLEALKRSCNTAFGQLGIDLGAPVLQAQAEAFGFGEWLRGADPHRGQPVPRRRQRPADRAVRDRAVRRGRDAAADGDGRRGGGQPGDRDEPLSRQRGTRPGHRVPRGDRPAVSSPARSVRRPPTP